MHCFVEKVEGDKRIYTKVDRRAGIALLACFLE